MTTPASASLFRFEIDAWERGYSRVAGIDEAGRGPLAGPVVAVAAIFTDPAAVPPAGLNDSKKLSASERIRIADELMAMASFTYGIACIDASEIDSINILRATFKAMLEASCAIIPGPDFILVDGNAVPPGLQCPAKAIIGGDAKSASIAAASVLAKVYRDRMMIEIDHLFPGYGFADHKGYGTAAHLAALERNGPCPIHRKSFAPVSRIAFGEPRQIKFDLPLELS